MAYQLSEDLIQQVQRATRAEVGLSNYDPTQNLPPLPSITEAVASFEPSPPYLRCKNCKGRLLRGLQSVLCVYCGRPNDVVHDPICFKDTVAFRWLLESLHLDGSEILGPPLERDSDRGQIKPDDEIRLSDLLDFKISWPTEEQKRENNVPTKKLEERSYLKFSGIDLDNFFFESRRLDASNKPEECQVMSNDFVTAEIKASSTNNLSFFENVPSSESAVLSSQDKDNHDFSGWEAEFKSANTGNQFDGSESFDLGVNSAVTPRNGDEKSKQSDPLSGSPVDSSSHVGSVIGSEKDSNHADLKDDSAASPSIGDCTSADNFNHKATLESKQPDPTVTIKDSLPQNNISNVDLSYQLDSMFGPKKELKDGKEKSDFTPGPSNSDWTSDDLWNGLSSETSQLSEPPVATVRLTDALPQDKTNNPSTSFDWFQVDQWQNDTNEPANNVARRDDAAISDWDEFTSSIPVQEFSDNAPTESRKQSIAASGSTSELFLFNSEHNLEEMDFGSFSQADPFRSPSGKESVSTELNNIGIAGSDRAIYIKSETGGSLLQADTSADVNNVSTQTREEVEMMLSQMHDLSFMLDDKLCLPPKS